METIDILIILLYNNISCVLPWRLIMWLPNLIYEIKPFINLTAGATSITFIQISLLSIMSSMLFIMAGAIIIKKRKIYRRMTAKEQIINKARSHLNKRNQSNNNLDYLSVSYDR